MRSGGSETFWLEMVGIGLCLWVKIRRQVPADTNRALSFAIDPS